MKIFVAIKSCHQYYHRADAQRETWLKHLPPEVDYKFILGKSLLPTKRMPRPDELHLNVSDHYYGLPEKIQAACLWIVAQGYDYAFFCDDDTYVVPERMLAAVPVGKDYVGRLRGPSGNWPAPYCSGFAYWMSAKAMKIVAETTIGLDPIDDRMIGNALMTHDVKGAYDARYIVSRCDEKATEGRKGLKDIAEDRTVGNTLDMAGVRPLPDYRYSVIRSSRNGLSGWLEPGPGNALIAVCEFEPPEMLDLHRRVRAALDTPIAGPERAPETPRATGALSRVAVMVKTFLRDNHLMTCLDGLEKNMAGCKIVVVDDGEDSKQKIIKYAKMRDAGHVCVWLPFDTGFSRKANAAIPHCDRDFVLIASDDFYFTPMVAQDVLKMIDVLDHDPTVAMASGRVNNNPYEWQWEEGPGWIREVKRDAGGGTTPSGTRYHYCDLTVNYGLVRRSVLDVVKWENTGIKIGGGEHAAWFLDLKRAGWKACYVEGCNIMEIRNLAMHPRYPMFRARARQPGRPLLKMRGIDTYMMGSGITEQS